MLNRLSMWDGMEHKNGITIESSIGDASYWGVKCDGECCTSNCRIPALMNRTLMRDGMNEYW